MTKTFINGLEAWGLRWRIPYPAMIELRDAIITAPAPEPTSKPVTSEAGVQQLVRLEASLKGLRVWRNNVGAMEDETGRVVRFGLANESKQVNEVIKSGDLIGIRPVVIEATHVGRTIGQFVSREIKEPGWLYSGTEREVAQANWATLVQSLGGDAGFAAGTGTL